MASRTDAQIQTLGRHEVLHFYRKSDGLSQEFWDPVRPLVQKLLDSGGDELIISKSGKRLLRLTVQEEG